MMHTASNPHIARTLHHRKSVARLTKEQLSWLREAFRAVLPIRDERGYNYHAGIHGLPVPGQCRHGDLLFLPWHRAYLYFFELALRDQVRFAALPWWDWASTSNVPEAYAAERIDGDENPLHSVAIPEAARQLSGLVGDAAPSRTFRRPGSRTPRLPTQQEVDSVLAAPNFLDFSNRVEELHDWVHVWVGGTMAEVTWAGFDPIFWAHHAMVDRLWRIWQLRNPEDNLDTAILRQALPPFPLTVEDTLDVTKLGYEYAVATEHVITI